MSANLYVGRRLSFDGSLCTVRYVGPLQGTKGEWLGVEWDDPSRGKHDGKHKGSQIFDCLSSSPTAASFIKPSRTPDKERTVLEAIEFKYGSGLNDLSASDVVVISGKVAEEVGFDKIAREQGQLSELRIVLIDQLVVNGLAPRAASNHAVLEAVQDLAQTCPNITELDLGWNTIEDWQTVAYICLALPKLRVLRTSGLRFRTFTHSMDPSPFSRIRELHLTECLISVAQSCQLLNDSGGFPSLEELYLSGNQLDNFLLSTISYPSIQKLSSLVLENNSFKTLDCIAAARSMFPNLKSVSLQANQITRVGMETSETVFPQIETLNLSRNDIASFAFIDDLPRKFPNLSSLHCTHNPFFFRSASDVTNDLRASDKSYYLTLARIPSLTALNYAKISPRDREEGELYFLSIAEKDLKALFATSDITAELVQQAKALYPRYQTLSEKYGRDSIIDQHLSSSQAGDGKATNALIDAKVTYPSGSLAARIISATFYIPGETSKTTPFAEAKLSLPSSLPVTRLMSILLQHAIFRSHLRPLRFKLIYESKELDPVNTTAESSTKSTIYGKNLSPEQKRAIWREWGDWDADAIINEKLRENSTNSIPETHNAVGEQVEHWTDDGKYCIKEGRRWARREVEIPRALKRPWGDWIENTKDVRVRIEHSTDI